MKVSVRAMLLALSLSFFAGQAHAVPFFSKKPEQTAQPAPLNLANSNADTGKSKFGLPKLPWSSDKEVEPMSEPLVERNVSPEQQLEGQISLARLSERRGQVEQAEEMYKALVARHPRLAVPRHRLGVIEARRGNYEAADHHFQAALSIDPHNAELLSDAAYSCYLQNRFEEAEALYKRAYTAAPNDARLCNNYGMLLTELGHVDQALAMFRKATSEAEAHANVGYVLVQLGEFDQARKHFDYALTLNPELRSAAHALLQLAEQGERAKLAKLAPQNQPSASEQQPESLVQAIGEQMNSPAAIVDANSQRSGGASQASLPRSMPNASAGEPTRATPVESRNFAPIETAAVETPRPAASPLPTPYARPTSPAESTAVELGSNYAARMQPAASARRTPTAEEAKQPTETNWPGAQPVAVASDVPGASSPRIASEQLP
ncbi:MAG: tetratricopeptide repeat protein, partial [Planctomycetales bacterium]|nr:tetratricopeptide repeat protein [Planctomycetales bacterium]